MVNDINIFLSYARRNTATAVDLERALEDVGVSVWRDQEKLYAGARWPKDLGEAVAGNDAVVLVWSAAASESQFVELEWCTALALGKPVLPYLIDKTPLPPVLASFHGIESQDPVTDAPRLIERLQEQPESPAGDSSWLLTALEGIRADEPEQAFRTVQAMLTTAAANTTGQRIDSLAHRGLGPSPFKAGAIIGDRYEIKSLLGRGGMGEVWRAFDLKIRVDVALKVLHGASDEKSLEVLRGEVRTARQVVSSNVCRIFDLGEADAVEFLSMEYVDGKTLAEVMAEGPMKVDEASPLASQILSGLQAIHDAGLVHRDIKPENLMVTRTGRVVVMDLGLARFRTDDGVYSVSGTPAYMAPEQLRGDQVDARCDVYAAGVVLAELTAPEGAATLAQRQAIWSGIQREPPQLPDTPVGRGAGQGRRQGRIGPLPLGPGPGPGAGAGDGTDHQRYRRLTLSGPGFVHRGRGGVLLRTRGGSRSVVEEAGRTAKTAGGDRSVRGGQELVPARRGAGGRHGGLGHASRHAGDQPVRDAWPAGCGCVFRCQVHRCRHGSFFRARCGGGYHRPLGGGQ